MDLYPATFRSFVVQRSAKIAGCRPPLKPLLNMCTKNHYHMKYAS